MRTIMQKTGRESLLSREEEDTNKRSNAEGKEKLRKEKNYCTKKRKKDGTNKEEKENKEVDETLTISKNQTTTLRPTKLRQE